MRNLLISLACSLTLTSPALAQSEPELTSWEDGPLKTKILSFVHSTAMAGESYVAPENRIATFDNDGTLWSEFPQYYQVYFAYDTQCANPIDALIEACAYTRQDVPNMAGEDVVKIIAASHFGLSVEAFQDNVATWLETAQHPTKTDMLFKDMIYQPMLELLDLLHHYEYKTFIVSGGGLDFVRVLSPEAYGIPTYQVTGSNTAAYYDEANGVVIKAATHEQYDDEGAVDPDATLKAEGFFVDDKMGKPVGINTHIGKRPILAIGNSDGDKQMLEYGDTSGMPHLGLILHHTDGVNEFAYDNEDDGAGGDGYSGPGHLTPAFIAEVEGNQNWFLIDMAADWTQVYVSN